MTRKVRSKVRQIRLIFRLWNLIQQMAAHLRKGQSANVFYKNTNVGSIGRLAEEIAQKFKFKQPVFVAEIDLQTVLESGEQEVFYQPLPSLPSVQRDVSLIVKRDKTFAEIKKFVE